MDKTLRQRVIVCIEPALTGSVVGAWLAGDEALDVRMGTRAVAEKASPTDIVIASRPLRSRAAVVAFHNEGNYLSVYRSGSIATYRYQGLERLGSLIQEVRKAS